MNFIKNNLVLIFCLIIISIVFINKDFISDKIVKSLEKNPPIVLKEKNEYFKDKDFIYVQNTDNFIPLSYGDIVNIYYTVTNSGYEYFTFYCPSEYKNCLNDANKISNDQEILTYINNFVHPFNGFSDIRTSLSESGEVIINVEYLYKEEEKKVILDKVDSIYKEIITDNMSNRDKIKTIHDYIINHTKYDVERNENNKSAYESHKAYGALIQGYATCNGYTDAMALFLEKMNITNYKVATELMQTDIEGHIWNAVYLDNKWLHLDLTWDDPVSDNGKDYLQHKYFLISTNELENVDKKGEVVVNSHVFNKSIYPELR